MKEIQGEVLLYQTAEGGPALDVRLERDTVWLDAHQMAELFGRDRTVIVRHIRNVYTTGELQRDSTCAKNAQVAADGKVRQMDCYNLDVIISVGYRVNSLRGTQFRIWATNILRQHLVQGYTVHERRLKELNQAVRLIADVAQRRTLSGDEATALLNVVGDYAYALEVLDDYDHQRVRMGEVSPARWRPWGWTRPGKSLPAWGSASAQPGCSAGRRMRAWKVPYPR